MLVLGVIDPLPELIDNPAVEEKVPPEYAPVPDKLTGWGELKNLQNGVPA